NSLALEVQRYLRDEPVLACPPSLGYAARKFARRHRAALAAGLLGVAVLVAAVVGLAVSNHLIRQEEAEKDAALAEAQTQRDDAGRQRDRVARERDNVVRERDRARDALDQATAVALTDWLSQEPRLTARQQEYLADALARYEAFTREGGHTAAERLALG